MEVINLKGVSIPSVNNKSGFNRKTGTFFLNKKYATFKEFLSQVCKRRMHKAPYRVGIYVETSKDCDNIEKVILDSLQGVCIDNDRNVLEKFTKKKQLKHRTKDSLIVWVESIQPDDNFFPFQPEESRD